MSVREMLRKRKAKEMTQKEKSEIFQTWQGYETPLLILRYRGPYVRMEERLMRAKDDHWLIARQKNK